MKIGILGDMSGVFQDLSGASSVAAARMAVDDFIKNEKPPFKVELAISDHQNKPDIAASRAREWYRYHQLGRCACGVRHYPRQESRAHGHGAGTTSLINEQCSPNTVLYAWDTYGI